MDTDLVHLLRSAARNVERILSHRARKIGLTSGQLTLLVMIQDDPGVIAKTLQEKYKSDKPTITRMLTELKKRNLVASTPGKDNFWRSKHYVLTQHGELVMKKGRAIHSELRTSVEDALNETKSRWSYLCGQLEIVAELE